MPSRTQLESRPRLSHGESKNEGRDRQANSFGKLRCAVLGYLVTVAAWQDPELHTNKLNRFPYFKPLVVSHPIPLLPVQRE